MNNLKKKKLPVISAVLDISALLGFFFFFCPIGGFQRLF